jgi:hypothetical protein
METLDAVADEPAAEPIPPAKLEAQQQAAERQAQFENHPSQSSKFNNMVSQLDKYMAEVSENKQQPEADVKPEAKLEDKAKPATQTTQQEKAPEKAPEPETFTSAKAADWKKLKEERQQWQSKAIEMEKKFLESSKELEVIKAKAAATDPSPELKKQIDALTAEKDKYLNQLETVALERSERFSNAFKKTFESAVARAKESAGEHAEKIEHLIQLPPSKWRKERIQEIVETVSDLDRAQIAMSIAEYDKARAEKEDALKNSKGNLARVQAMEAEVQKRDMEMKEANVSSAISSLMATARKHEAFTVKDGDEEHNAMVKANEVALENFLRGKMSGAEVASLAIDGLEGRRVRDKVVTSLTKKVEELEAAVKEYQSATPGTSGKSAKTTKSSATDLNDHNARPFMQRFAQEYQPGT